jgi:hypothetical protein
MIERYFDAFLYPANWRTRHLMIRLPRGLLGLTVAEQLIKRSIKDLDRSRLYPWTRLMSTHPDAQPLNFQTRKRADEKLQQPGETPADPVQFENSEKDHPSAAIAGDDN